MGIKGHFRTGLVEDPGAIPLVIAVAGHRDPLPEMIPGLREIFRHHLRELMLELPHTPIILLNGLATGMDSEAAEVFLEETDPESFTHRNRPNHQLIAVLPKPVKDYIREDFSDNASDQARLKSLLRNCSAVLDPQNCTDLIPEEESHNKENDGKRNSDRCYAKQSEFLVRHCYLLVAFYNGKDNLKPGGTGQTVAMQRGDIYPLFMHVNEVIAAREPGILIEIKTPRLSDEKTLIRTIESTYWRERSDLSQPSENSTLNAKDIRDLLQSSKIANELDRINKKLLGYPPREKYNPGLESSLWLYADEMANTQKRIYMQL